MLVRKFWSKLRSSTTFTMRGVCAGWAPFFGGMWGRRNDFLESVEGFLMAFLDAALLCVVGASWSRACCWRGSHAAGADLFAPGRRAPHSR